MIEIDIIECSKYSMKAKLTQESIDQLRKDLEKERDEKQELLIRTDLIHESLKWSAKNGSYYTNLEYES